MQLNISYDLTTLANAPAAFFSAVNYVVNLFDTIFTNNSTVNIEVGYGNFPEDGSPVTPLGTSDQNNVVFGDYSTVRQILVSDGAPGANTLPSSSPNGGRLTLGSAQEKALGLIGANTSLDGWVGVASDDELAQVTGGSWSFDPTATPSSDQFYIVGVIEHEFTEVMGRTSYLTTSGEYGIPDLYRYIQSGSRQTGAGDPSYFSIDGGNTNLDNWNNLGISGGDLGDWAPNPGPHGSLNFKYAGADAFLSESSPGVINGLSAADLTLMAALGWNATPPRPGSQYLFSAPNKTVNLVSTNDGENLPAAVAGQFNIELVTQPAGTAYPLPSGYQAVAILPGGTGRALRVLSGDVAIDDTGSGDAITLGSGAQTVIGATGDTITGGIGTLSVDGSRGGQRIIAGSGASTILGGVGDAIAGGTGSLSVDGSLGGQQIGGGSGLSTILGGAGDTITGSTGAGAATIIGAAGASITSGSGSDLVDAAAGAQSIIGGSGPVTVIGGDADSIAGGAGPMTVVGGARNSMTIAGGANGLTAYDFGTHNTVTGGANITFIDDGYGSGGGNTLVGGSGGSNYVNGGTGDLLVGGNGPVTVLDAVLFPSQTVVGGPGLATIVEGGQGDSIIAGSGLFAFVSALSSSTIEGGSNAIGVTDVYSLGDNDSIVGGAGTLIVGAATTNSTIRGGSGNLETFGLGPSNSVVGSTAGTTRINDVTGGNATLIGGAGATTIIAGAGDSIVGKAGALEVRIRSDIAGVEAVNLSAAAAIIRDVSIDGGAGAAASVTGFNTAADKIASSTDSGAFLVAHSTTDGSGDVVLHFSDSSTMTLANVADVNAIVFTA